MGRAGLDYFLNPRGIAVVGASTVPHKTGGRRWRSQVQSGFAGPLYPIHPNAAEVLGRKAYRSIRDLPDAVDLAVLLIRPEMVSSTVRDCAELGIRGVTVITAGFGETGKEGKKAEQELVELLHRADCRMIGPNSAGLFSASGHVNVLGWEPPKGPVALVSQSGNMALTFAQLARERGLGFSKVVNIGNAADIGIPEYIDYFSNDPDTKVILVYLEGLQAGEGRRLYETAIGLKQRKPIVFLKPGGTNAGRRAALSHTGALAGEDHVVDAAFRQCGIIRVAESEEAWDAVLALASSAPMIKGSLCVVSDGGGHATVVCEAAERHGLRVPDLSPSTQAELASMLPARCPIANPVDFAGVAEEEPEIIPRVLATCLKDPGIGAVVLAGHLGGYHKISSAEHGRREVEIAGEIADLAQSSSKPLLFHSIYAQEDFPAFEALRKGNVQIYRSLEGVARAAAALSRYQELLRLVDRLATPRTRRSGPDQVGLDRLLSSFHLSGARVLTEWVSRQVLSLYGIPVPTAKICRTPSEAVAAARAFGNAVALKLMSPDLVHKSDVSGVVLNVEAVTSAEVFSRLMGIAESNGYRDAAVLVAPMIEDGIEVIVGSFNDAQFGPVVMFGLGGLMVELFKDVSFRLAPFGPADAHDLINETRAATLLNGYRGRRPVSIDGLVDLLVGVSELAADRPDIAEIDLNPIFVQDGAALVADARIVLKDCVSGAPD